MDAPLGSVEFEEADELRRLRRRAYGPDADIMGDAAAQVRLSELEAAQRRQATPVVDAAAGVRAPAPERVPVAEPIEGAGRASTSVPQPVDGAFAEHEPDRRSATEQDPAEGSIADSGPVDAAPAAPWWHRRRWILVIVGGAIAVLALNVALVASMSQLLADRSTPMPTETSTAKMPPVPGREPTYGPGPDYVLALESVAVAPDDPHGILDALGISPDELRRYEDFRGLSVWSGESRYGLTCLLVAVPGQGLREGLSAEGCSPGGLEPIAELVHPGSDGFSTGAVFAGLPTGGLIRFVLLGDHVSVYLFVRVADPSGSQG